MHVGDAIGARRTRGWGAVAPGLLPLALVATAPSPDIALITLDGETHTVEEWLTTFHLASVVLDPYTNESSWMLKTRCTDPRRAPRHRRAGQLRASPARPTTPRRSSDRSPTSSWCSAIRTGRSSRASAWRTLPAFVFVRIDGTVPAAAEGWNPAEWRHGRRGDRRRPRPGSRPTIPVAGDPGPFHGTPALARADAVGRCGSPQALRDLPVVEVLADLAARADRRPRTPLLVAPPGAGKTTAAPLCLLDARVARRAARS